MTLIEQELAMAAKLLKLASSSLYNHKNKEITNLKAAFLKLGVNGLLEGVLNSFLSELEPQIFIYFQLF